MFDEDERRELRKEKKRYAANEAEIDAALAALLQHRQGRRLVYWLLETAGIGRNPFTQNALATAHNCGELNNGLRLQARVLKVAPQLYLKMITEMEDERRAADLDRETGSAAGNDD